MKHIPIVVMMNYKSSLLSGLMMGVFSCAAPPHRDSISGYLHERNPTYALIAYPLSEPRLPPFAEPAPTTFSDPSLTYLVCRFLDEGVAVSPKGVYDNYYTASLLVPPWEQVPAAFDCFYTSGHSSTPEQISNILQVESIYRQNGKDVYSYRVRGDADQVILEKIVGGH
ncbi:MAG: hypothetical protein AABX72_03530 [Nanoarchaeota archaeon]